MLSQLNVLSRMRTTSPAPKNPVNPPQTLDVQTSFSTVTSQLENGQRRRAGVFESRLAMKPYLSAVYT
jgi:hypothetical protein